MDCRLIEIANSGMLMGDGAAGLEVCGEDVPVKGFVGVGVRCEDLYPVCDGGLGGGMWDESGRVDGDSHGACRG